MSTPATATENTRTGKTSFADVALVSELKDKGWRVEGSGREWKAFEIANEANIVGPATSVKALHSQLMLVVGNLGDQPKENGNGKAASNGNGSAKPKTVKAAQPTLPNTQNAVLEDLRSSIIDYRETTMRILELQKTQKSQGDTVKALMHKFEDELQIDSEGNKFFQAEMIRAKLVIEEKEVLKTEEVKG